MSSSDSLENVEVPSEKSDASSQISKLIVAIIDNNSWEVGMAELDVLHPTRLSVSQITDNRSYSATLERLELLQPAEILVPDSHFCRPLAEALRGIYGIKVTALNRSMYNETQGGKLMNDLAKSQIQTKQHLHSHYLGRAAANALVVYAERQRSGEVIRRLVVELDPWIQTTKRLKIDASTIRSLELLLNRRTSGKEATLFSVLKRTRTSMGARLLRGQIISPPADPDLIQARYDAISAYLEAKSAGDDQLTQAHSALTGMCDLDRVCSRFSSEPKRFTIRELKAEIEAVLNVREFAERLDLLIKAIEPLQSEFWDTTSSLLQEFNEILNELCEQINSITAKPVATSRTDHHLHDIFCVKADVDGLLDIGRLAYVQVVKDMETLVEGLREETGLRSLDLKRTTGRGYHLSVPRAHEGRLPATFVQAVRHRKSILCTTPELASLNNKQDRLESEILALTVARLRPLRDSISNALPQLLQISETVALVDMILGFAELSDNEAYCKPVLFSGEAASLKVEDAYHPILHSIIDECEPRNIHLGPDQRLLIVTGENCAGKTTTLTQIGLTAIMAQLGCFVPARTCHLPIFYQLCSRMATDDALEENASTFSLEMVETASILQVLQKSPPQRYCLVLIDELGRGTSSRDGLAIAAAVAENILSVQAARCVFATHFVRLGKLVEVYPEYVRSLLVQPSNKDGDQIVPVDLENDSYGIRLAEECSMPPDVIALAKSMRERLSVHFAPRKINMDSDVADERSLALNELLKVLQAIARKVAPTGNSENCNVQEARRLFIELRRRLV